MDDPITRAKRSLRREMSARRRSMAPELRDSASAAIAAAVFAMPEFECARRVLGYVALPDEASLDAVLQRVLAHGRTLLLPRVDATRLAYVAVRDLGDLQRDRLGIQEPAPGSAGATLEAGDLIFVPGVAFDRQGGRLGRGGGHYDRSLPRGLRAFGVAFSFQLVHAVPIASHDRCVDGVVTELGVMRRALGDREPDPG